MNRKLFAALAILAAAALPAFAGEYHSGANLECYDCHTPHHSMQHNWDGTTPVPATAAPNGNWLGAGLTNGANQFLLKAPANQLCLSCHDQQTFAPDVLQINTGGTETQGRNAGALNEIAGGQGYLDWMGHTLESTTTPPGWNPAAVGAPATWYNPATGLECISCHAQHGPATSYRNLGSYALGGAASSARPTYVISTADNTTKDVWINLASYTTAGNGNPASFSPYYDFANIAYNRNDATVGTTKTSNRMDTFCGTCHGDFHGGPGDTMIGASVAALDGFLRHPTSQETIGAAAAQGYGGHTSLADYTTGIAKVRVYASDQTAFTDASPGCVSCHKAHGNLNPFGLIFMAQGKAAALAGPITEQGVYEVGQIQNTATGQRNLCGQCHTQGNN